MTENTPGAPGPKPERPQQSAEGTTPAEQPQASPWAAAPQQPQQSPAQPGGLADVGFGEASPAAGTPVAQPASGAQPGGAGQSVPGGQPGSGYGQPTSANPTGLGTPGAHSGSAYGTPSSHGAQSSDVSGGGPGGYPPPGGPGYGAPLTNPLGVPVQTVPQQRKAGGRGKLVAGALALVLLGGAIGGGIGGAVAYNLAGSSTSASSGNALNQPRPAAKDINSPAPQGSIEQVAQKVLPSVVQLKVTGQGAAGSGSGIVLSSDGMILTNNHVVEAAAVGGEILVQFNDGRTAKAKIVGRDVTSDLAVVKVDGVSGLTPAELGRSDDLRVGQQVVAIGAPFGLSSTVTSGIVSAVQRPVRTGESQDQATVMDAVQTDASINPGNSGGPLVDMQGKVIGINSAIRTAASGGAGGQQQGGSIGLGFAIPVDQVRRIAEELIKNGKATHSLLGVGLGQPTRNQQSQGATVSQVTQGGAAEQAGIKVGDVITKIDNRRIEDADSLIAAVRSYAPGSKVKLTINTAGGDRVVEVTLGSQNLDNGPR
ncbi:MULTISPECIES: S1C family serine protease [unclassified Crossiella]|uniref:S1C family serine protease n=1 Tax=unclassified Crossiella TaxID=2620835 RepID=UPI001FFF3C90|nr:MULTISPECIES: trypsin-like peptidase domain-containing protein [unclassified Crossiella]MCK2238123.1 trypsin-like peptidase domain-containing protein [Crossiella sp. S99.2]MCK2256163.1 trypsin-like peptidase domain-containing protein [Crossiella sp. S99.1]